MSQSEFMDRLKTCGPQIQCLNKYKLIKLSSQLSSMERSHVIVIVNIIIGVVTIFSIIIVFSTAAAMSVVCELQCVLIAANWI